MRRWWKALFPALAVLAPAIALAVLGLRSYQAEQILAEARFRASLRSIADLTATVLDDSTHAALRELVDLARSGTPSDLAVERVRARHPLVGQVFALDRSGRFLYPSISSSPRSRRDAHASLVPAQPGRLPRGGARLSRLVATYHQRLKRELEARRLLSRARRAELLGQARRALAGFRQVVSRSVRLSPEAWHGVARAALAARRWREAVRAFQVMRLRYAAYQDWAAMPFSFLSRFGMIEVARRCRLPPRAGAARTASSARARARARARGVHPSGCPAGLGSPSELALSLYADLVSDRPHLDPVPRMFYLDWLRKIVHAPRRAEVRRRLTELDASVALLSAGVAFAQRVGRGGARDIVEHAGYRPRALRMEGFAERGALLVVRRVGARVVGFVLRTDALRAQLARPELRRRVPAGYRLRLRRLPIAPATASPSSRPILLRPLGAALGDLGLAIYGPGGTGGSWIARQSRISRGALEYLAIVGGLVLVLMAGLITVWRGVRREMELARLKSEFVSNVSHELKTPLTSIRMFAEMLEADLQPDPEQRKTYYRVMVAESERLGRLIGNVLDFSRLERGTRTYAVETLSMGEMAREAVSRFRNFREAEARTIVFALDADGDVSVDRDAVVESLLNLLVNAAKYSPEGRPIRVRVCRPVPGSVAGEGAATGADAGSGEGEGSGSGGGEDEVEDGDEDTGAVASTGAGASTGAVASTGAGAGTGVDALGDEVAVEVTDQGIGIPKAERKHIFDDFYRASNVPAGREGTGLGLALVRRHCVALGGRVDLASRVGQGSTFRMRFPGVRSNRIA